METQNNNAANNTIEVTKSSITVDKISENPFKPSLDQAQLRQIFTKKYPDTKSHSNMQDSLFSDKELGIKTEEFNENRVAFIPVPKGADAQKVLAIIPEGAIIYKVLSLNAEAVLTNNDWAAINNKLVDSEGKLVTLESVSSKYIVPSPEDNAKPQLYSDTYPQYRRCFYSNTPKEDVDTRMQDMITLGIPTTTISTKKEVSKEEVAQKM